MAMRYSSAVVRMRSRVCGGGGEVGLIVWERISRRAASFCAVRV